MNIKDRLKKLLQLSGKLSVDKKKVNSGNYVDKKVKPEIKRVKKVKVKLGRNGAGSFRVIDNSVSGKGSNGTGGTSNRRSKILKLSPLGKNKKVKVIDSSGKRLKKLSDQVDKVNNSAPIKDKKKSSKNSIDSILDLFYPNSGKIKVPRKARVSNSNVDKTLETFYGKNKGKISDPTKKKTARNSTIDSLLKALFPDKNKNRITDPTAKRKTAIKKDAIGGILDTFSPNKNKIIDPTAKKSGVSKTKVSTGILDTLFPKDKSKTKLGVPKKSGVSKTKVSTGILDTLFPKDKSKIKLGVPKKSGVSKTKVSTGILDTLFPKDKSKTKLGVPKKSGVSKTKVSTGILDTLFPNKNKITDPTKNRRKSKDAKGSNIAKISSVDDIKKILEKGGSFNPNRKIEPKKIEKGKKVKGGKKDKITLTDVNVRKALEIIGGKPNQWQKEKRLGIPKKGSKVAPLRLPESPNAQLNPQTKLWEAGTGIKADGTKYKVPLSDTQAQQNQDTEFKAKLERKAKLKIRKKEIIAEKAAYTAKPDPPMTAEQYARKQRKQQLADAKEKGIKLPRQKGSGRRRGGGGKRAHTMTRGFIRRGYTREEDRKGRPYKLNYNSMWVNSHIH